MHYPVIKEINTVLIFAVRERKPICSGCFHFLIGGYKWHVYFLYQPGIKTGFVANLFTF
jgi:hypothetical protein